MLVIVVALCHWMLVPILLYFLETISQMMSKNGLEYKLLVEKFIVLKHLQKLHLRPKKKTFMSKVHCEFFQAVYPFHALLEILKQRERSMEEMQMLLFVNQR
jgi:hypothetical protein